MSVPPVHYVSNTSPVILLEYEDLVNERDISEQLSIAYGPKGLGILVVRGVPGFVEKRARLLPLAAKFASLPDDIKAKYEHVASHYNFGWSHGKETFAGQPDFAKGSYYANPLYDQPFTDAELVAKFPSFCAPNIWPGSDLPDLEPAFKELGQLICSVGFMIAKQCDRYVKTVHHTYETDKLYNIIKNSKTAKARLLHYFPMTVSGSACTASTQPSDADDMGSWCGWHNDHGSLTGLCSAMFINEKGHQVPNPDQHSGLYIKSRTGDLVKAVIPTDCLAFQIGETAQVHSAGVLQATPHCVRAGSIPGISRETFAVFMEPEMFEAMNLPKDVPATAITGGTHAFLPKGVPPLSRRWKPEDDFGTFTNKTLDAYHPDKQDHPDESA